MLQKLIPKNIFQVTRFWKKLTCFSVWPVCIIWYGCIPHSFSTTTKFLLKNYKPCHAQDLFDFQLVQINFLCNGPTSIQVFLILYKRHIISGFISGGNALLTIYKIYNYLHFNIVLYVLFKLRWLNINEFVATTLQNITFASTILSTNRYRMNEKEFYYYMGWWTKN